MIKTQTNTSNINGFQNEDIFAMLGQMLQRKGYLTAVQHRLVSKNPPIFSMGNEIRADFYFEGKPAAPNGFVISAKYQEIEGTADSKVYYEVDWIIKKCLPCPAVLLVRGDHWVGYSRQRAREWLESRWMGNI